MHGAERVAEALTLLGSGHSQSEVARRLGIPRSTIKDWAAGRLPGSSQRGGDRYALGPWARPEDLPAAYVYLLGLYLGDGCISAHRRNVHRLRITLDTKYPRIVNECRRAVESVVPGNRVSLVPRGGGRDKPPTHVDVSAYSKGWPLLLPQHGPGMKHTRAIELTDWQWSLVRKQPELLLRGLIHSDGCRAINTGTNWRHPRYVFSNVSDDIRRIFCEACDLLGLHYTHAPRTVYVSRKADVAVLDSFIGPKR